MSSTPPPFRHYPVGPAGFWVRLAALMVDLALIGIVANLVLLGFRSAHSPAWTWTLGNFLFVILYFGTFYSWRGATPGKMVFGIRVRHGSSHPGFFRSVARELLGKPVSLLVLFGGFIMAGIRRDKIALHDLFFGTRVLKIAPLQPAWVAAAIGAFILNAGLSGALLQKLSGDQRAPASVASPR
jgi:uncharacterized RDD family membrane protein YckC